MAKPKNYFIPTNFGALVSFKVFPKSSDFPNIPAGTRQVQEQVTGQSPRRAW